MVTVSVVIPVRDDAVALARCLASLARQQVAPLEVIVVDNGSRDVSAAVATAAGARVVAEPQPGIAAAASRGYDAARGDVIARCDADSLLPPDWVARIASRMAADPGLHAVTGSGRFSDLPAGWRALASTVYLGAYYLLTHAALGHTALWGSNMALRRDTWRDVRHLVHRDDPEVHDDMDLAFQLGAPRRPVYDRRLRVGVSARSLRGRRQLRRRFRRAWHTLALNWRVLPPWTRWRQRLAAGLPEAVVCGGLPRRAGRPR